MKPVYANTFGLRKVCNSEGEILEITLDATYKYMETTMTVTSNGVEAVSTPAAERVVSLVMNRANALSLRDLLDKMLAEG